MDSNEDRKNSDRQKNTWDGSDGQSELRPTDGFIGFY